LGSSASEEEIEDADDIVGEVDDDDNGIAVVGG
jgi:hypothetical protein